MKEKVSHTEVIESIDKIRSWTAQRHQKKETAAIVIISSAQAVHPGHLALIERGKEKATHVVVCIFEKSFVTNTAPINNQKCITKTGCLEKKDPYAMLSKAGASIIFAPSKETLFPKGYSTFITEEILSKKLNGAPILKMFRNDTTLAVTLCNLIKPNYFILGQKDIQQTYITQKVFEDLCIDTKIEVITTQRDPKGLAYSISNFLLEDFELSQAYTLYQGLLKAQEMVKKGIYSADRIIAELTHLFSKHLKIRINYICLVTTEDLSPISQVIPEKTLLILSVWVGQTRLNDNILL